MLSNVTVSGVAANVSANQYLPIGPYPNWNQQFMYYQPTPHCCPVCEGRQKVEEGFYDDEPPFPYYDPLKCRSCWGTGVLWR